MWLAGDGRESIQEIIAGKRPFGRADEKVPDRSVVAVLLEIEGCNVKTHRFPPDKNNCSAGGWFFLGRRQTEQPRCNCSRNRTACLPSFLQYPLLSIVLSTVCTWYKVTASIYSKEAYYATSSSSSWCFRCVPPPPKRNERWRATFAKTASKWVPVVVDTRV